MKEVLTLELCKEYQRRLASVPRYGMQDVKERRKLRVEFQHRFGLPELDAINALNGCQVRLIVRNAEIRAEKERLESGAKI